MNNGGIMKNLEKYIFLFFIGGIGYGLIEVSFRGFTHWSMVITGGSAIVVLYLISESFNNTPILLKSFAGSAVITLMELTVGLVVNKLYSFFVWDYTDLPINFLGQISLSFSIAWYGLSFTLFLVFNIIKKIMQLQIPYKSLRRAK